MFCVVYGIFKFMKNHGGTVFFVICSRRNAFVQCISAFAWNTGHICIENPGAIDNRISPPILAFFSFICIFASHRLRSQFSFFLPPP